MSSGKNPGGHKANVNDPNTSEESKERSRDVIQEFESGIADLTSSDGSDHATDESGKNINRVLGGFQAAVHNPNTSEEAKERAKTELEKHGINIE